jgi:hypothetical protein
VIEVRRPSDNELCGHVVESDGQWQALTVFGGLLGTHSSRLDAQAQVASIGLSSLAERWHLRTGSDQQWQVVCIQEAHFDLVRLALGYYSLPGVPVIEVTRDELTHGARLVLKEPMQQ